MASPLYRRTTPPPLPGERVVIRSLQFSSPTHLDSPFAENTHPRRVGCSLHGCSAFRGVPYIALIQSTDLGVLLLLTPTLLTCWILFRSGISIPHSVLCHYVLQIIYAFVSSLCSEHASNASKGISDQRITAPLPIAIRDALEITAWAVPWSATFALVCYAALSLSKGVYITEPCSEPRRITLRCTGASPPCGFGDSLRNYIAIPAGLRTPVNGMLSGLEITMDDQKNYRSTNWTLKICVTIVGQASLPVTKPGFHSSIDLTN